MVGGQHLCWAVLNYLLDEVAHFKAIVSCKATNRKWVLMPLLDWTPCCNLPWTSLPQSPYFCLFTGYWRCVDSHTYKPSKVISNSVVPEFKRKQRIRSDANSCAKLCCYSPSVAVSLSPCGNKRHALLFLHHVANCLYLTHEQCDTLYRNSLLCSMDFNQLRRTLITH